LPARQAPQQPGTARQLPDAGFRTGIPQFAACNNEQAAEFANRRAWPLDKIPIAQPLLPAVSFLGGFQTPTGPQMTSRAPIRTPSETHHENGLGSDFRMQPLFIQQQTNPAKAFGIRICEPIRCYRR
jgi:hypothetical protein